MRTIWSATVVPVSKNLDGNILGWLYFPHYFDNGIPPIISSIRQTYSNMFLFLGWYYKLANVLGNIAGGPHTCPLAGQETLQVAQWSAWFRLGKWVGSRRVYIYIYCYHLIYPLGMCSWAAVVSYHTDARKQHLPQGPRVPNVLAQRNQKKHVESFWCFLVNS